MREKYNTLALKDLKAIAKIRKIKGYSTMSKDEIVDAMVALDEQEAAAKMDQANKAVHDAQQEKERLVAEARAGCDVIAKQKSALEADIAKMTKEQEASKKQKL